jgi:translation elongation factor EF-Tu-like GTPase
MFQKTLDETVAGDNVGIITWCSKENILRGMVLAEPKQLTHINLMLKFMLNKERRWSSYTFFPWL